MKTIATLILWTAAILTPFAALLASL